MAKGYPNKRRARRAYQRGRQAAKSGAAPKNPYRNPRLALLFARGYWHGAGLGPGPTTDR